jgi:enediyne biosynthesis protein E4
MAIRPLLQRLCTPLLFAVICACGGHNGGGSSSPEAVLPLDSGSPPTSVRDDWFTDQATVARLDFVHDNGMSGRFFMPEIMGPGVGLLDYDNDGDLDVYFPQGRRLGRDSIANEQSPGTGARAQGGRLYRNDLMADRDGVRMPRFVDVTEQSGIVASEYGMGVAVGDIDNDGWIDLYLTSFGRNQMFRNLGNGTFADMSKQSGTDHRGWTVSASFLDYDHDGLLDLFLGNYLLYTVATDKECYSGAGTRNYCGPEMYRAEPDRLFHNVGGGRFVDVTDRALLGRTAGAALGVATADYNGDGWIDIYVANDGSENHLWLNGRNGTFTNTALIAGAALPLEGQPEASMGVDAGDFDNDGDEDLFMTELNGEGSNLYVNDGSGTFEERGAASGLGPATLRYTGFGTAWLDFDNDGWLDLLSANGLVGAVGRQRSSGTFPYAQRLTLFRNLGNGRFESVADRAGAVFQQEAVGRGAAFGDIDNDGDIDVVVANAAGPAQLLVNRIERKHWLGLRLVGERSSRDMVGARVSVVTADGRTLWRRARADGSYASSNDPRVLVGLGDSSSVKSVTVHWPSGDTDEWSGLGIDRWTTLRQDTGR